MEDFKFNLGDEVKEIISGFIGIVRGRSQYLTGCNTYGLQSQKLTENKPSEWVWADEMQLKLVKSKKIKLIEEKEIKTGGPMNSNQCPPYRS